MRDPRVIELMARQSAHELSEQVHQLEGLPGFRGRRLVFNDLSDKVLAVLFTLLAPRPQTYSEHVDYIQELSDARRSLTAMRALVERCRARGWIDDDRAEQMNTKGEEVSALMLLFASNLRREHTRRVS